MESGDVLRDWFDMTWNDPLHLVDAWIIAECIKGTVDLVSRHVVKLANSTLTDCVIKLW